MLPFQQHQLDFINAIKNPTSAIPGQIPAERMQVYRELFFNNVAGFITQAFPVLQSLLNDQQFSGLCGEFFQQAHCESPYFIDISKAFLAWLPSASQVLPPFALQLATYEWLELKVACAQVPSAKPSAQVISIDTPLVLTETAELLAADYPLPRIRAGMNVAPEPTFLLLYRDAHHQVRFSQLSVATFAALECLQQMPASSAQQIATLLHDYFPSLSLQDLQAMLHQQLLDFAKQGVVQMTGETPRF